MDHPDIVIVGAGTAGMPCAIEAVAAGARVLVVDQAARVGGTLHVSLGQLSGAGSRLQADRGIADTAQALGAFCRYGTSLPPRLSELAILVTGAFWASGFEWAVHAPIARKAGLSDAVIEAIRQGQTPGFLHEDEAIIHAFASELHRDHKVQPATYARATAAFGEQAVVELVGILGYYTLISMTINAFEVPLPAGAPDPFPT